MDLIKNWVDYKKMYLNLKKAKYMIFKTNKIERNQHRHKTKI